MSANRRAASDANRPMTHEERRRLIETPITFHVYGSRAMWSGTGVTNLDAESRYRVYSTFVFPEDENSLYMRWKD